jgi:hypothetical protein
VPSSDNQRRRPNCRSRSSTVWVDAGICARGNRSVVGSVVRSDEPNLGSRGRATSRDGVRVLLGVAPRCAHHDDRPDRAAVPGGTARDASRSRFALHDTQRDSIPGPHCPRRGNATTEW